MQIPKKKLGILATQNHSHGIIPRQKEMIRIRNIDRRYERHKWKGKATLKSWRQRRCQKCQRFLTKKQYKYCLACAKEIAKEQINQSHTRISKIKGTYHGNQRGRPRKIILH